MNDRLEAMPGDGSSAMDAHVEIDRRDTGLRILLTILFGIVDRVIQGLLGIIVILSLIIALFSRRPPPRRLREFANLIVTYSYRIGRYLTYNESRVPFPFSEFPEAAEPEAYQPEETESRALGIPQIEPDDDSDDPDASDADEPEEDDPRRWGD